MTRLKPPVLGLAILTLLVASSIAWSQSNEVVTIGILDPTVQNPAKYLSRAENANVRVSFRSMTLLELNFPDSSFPPETRSGRTTIGLSPDTTDSVRYTPYVFAPATPPKTSTRPPQVYMLQLPRLVELIRAKADPGLRWQVETIVNIYTLYFVGAADWPDDTLDARYKEAKVAVVTPAQEDANRLLRALTDNKSECSELRSTRCKTFTGTEIDFVDRLRDFIESRNKKETRLVVMYDSAIKPIRTNDLIAIRSFSRPLSVPPERIVNMLGMYMEATIPKETYGFERDLRTVEGVTLCITQYTGAGGGVGHCRNTLTDEISGPLGQRSEIVRYLMGISERFQGRVFLNQRLRDALAKLM